MLPAPFDPYAPETRATAASDATARPRVSVTPTVASVNQPAGTTVESTVIRGKRVGSTVTCQSVSPSSPARCHHPRARVRNAVTDDWSTLRPPDGPAPIPTPQRGADQSSPPTPRAAAGRPPSLHAVPGTVHAGPNAAGSGEQDKEGPPDGDKASPGWGGRKRVGAQRRCAPTQQGTSSWKRSTYGR